MSWIVPVVLMITTALLFGLAIFTDHAGSRPRLATAFALCGLFAFITMMVTLPDVHWPTEAPPRHHPVSCADLAWLDGRWVCAEKLPQYDPIECADLAWLDGQWTCIRFEEQG